MVAMRVRDEDMRDVRAADRVQERVDMGGIVRPGIEHGERPSPIRKVFVPRKVKGPAFPAVTRLTPGATVTGSPIGGANSRLNWSAIGWPASCCFPKRCL